MMMMMMIMMMMLMMMIMMMLMMMMVMMMMMMMMMMKMMMMMMMMMMVMILWNRLDLLCNKHQKILIIVSSTKYRIKIKIHWTDYYSWPCTDKQIMSF